MVVKTYDEVGLAFEAVSYTHLGHLGLDGALHAGRALFLQPYVGDGAGHDIRAVSYTHLAWAVWSASSPIHREGFGRPVPRSSGAGLEPSWESLGSGRSERLLQLGGGEGIFLKNGPLSPPHHKIFL